MEDFKKFSMYSENEETTASGGTEGSTGVEKEIDDVLQIYLPDEYYEDIRKNLIPAIKVYCDQQNAACLAALKECEDKNARLSETINELKCEIAYLEEQYKNKAH